MLLFMAGLAACTRNVDVDSEWEENVSHNQSFRQVLVIGQSPNVSARCDFESFMATQVRSDLPPADSLSAVFHFGGGAIGSYLATYGLDSPWDDWLHIIGEAGSLRVMRSSSSE